MKTRANEVIKTIVSIKKRLLDLFRWQFEEGWPAITETDLPFLKKSSLLSFNVQNKTFGELFFKVLTVINCPMKAFYRFT